MFGTAAPFLGQGGIDPRMVSGPANAYMQQMQSLPIQGMGGGGFQGMGGQGPQMNAMRNALQGYQGGGAMPWGQGQPGGMQPNGGMPPPGQFPGQSDAEMMYGRKPDPYGIAGRVNQTGAREAPFWGGNLNAINQLQGIPQSGPGSMSSYMPQAPQAMPGPPMQAQPRQPFQPQGPGQRVTQEQLAARGLNPQEIQRKLQQFAGGQLGWQQQGGPGGGQGGGRGGSARPNMTDPTTGLPIDPSSFVDNRFPGGMPGGRPDPNDPRVQDFIRKMSGNPMGGGRPGGPTDQGVSRRMPPRGVQQPPNDMIMRPMPTPGEQPPIRRRGPYGGPGLRDNRQQTDVTNIRY